MSPVAALTWCCIDARKKGLLFCKKEAKNSYPVEPVVGNITAPTDKRFLVLFFKKEQLALRLTCPFCGPRGIEEFSYAGDATLTRPGANAEQSAWVDYVYFRDNEAGPHSELWYHAAACRQIIRITRDTRTHEILATNPVMAELDPVIHAASHHPKIASNDQA